MRVFLTGGSGFIGKAVLAAGANDSNLNFVVAGRSETQSPNEQSGNNVYVKTDYSIESLSKCLSGCDAIVHLAGRRLSKDCNDVFANYLENVTISENLFQAALVHDIANIVNISTIGVYAGNRSMPWKEDSLPAPINNYALSKLVVENISRMYNSKHAMAIKSLRVAQVLGPGERSGYMLSEFLKKAMNKEAISIYGKGTGRRQYVYIKDLADIILLLLEESKAEGGLYNVGLPTSTSIAELAIALNSVFENPTEIMFLDKPEDLSSLLMDVSKITGHTSWKPIWTIEAALRDMKPDLEK